MLIRIFLVFSFCMIGIAEAQNNLIMMNETGEQFWLYVNDRKINENQQSIVKATTIYDDTCHVRVVYADTKLVDFNGRVYLLQNGRSCKDLDFTYSIETVKKKQSLKFISINYMTTDNTSPKEKPGDRIKKVFISVQKEKDDSNRLAGKYPDPTPCIRAVKDSLTELQVKYLKNNHIELNRIKDAKWFISNNCLCVAQMQKVLSTFDYEDSKRELAEFAYDYLFDKENFMQLNTLLRYRFEQTRLEDFYNKKKTK